MTRESLYVASTRGRTRTTWYAATEDLLDADCAGPAEPRMTGLDVLTTALKHRGAETAATTAIREASREATTLPTLVPRYRHTWDLAAMAVLHEAMADALDARMAARVRVDKGARHLATTLAQAAGRGADPTRLLRAAAELDDLEDARSPALVLASRIEDLPSALGIPRDEPAKKPLPWLPAPSVGHPEWDRYLAERAGLIAARATELGSLAAAYREQYTLTHLPVGDLGDPPPDMTSQQQAYQAVLNQQAIAAARAEPPGPTTAQVPARHLPHQQRGRHLST